MPENLRKDGPKAAMELLAPAGDFAALEAALEAGAGAVYFGLTSLNARRRAKNFRQEEFVHAVETVHARGAKAYLTLNVDVTERELGQAGRIMELARQCGVDAVLVRDPALFALGAAYPELPLHFSTQTCMASSADVSAARELGASRVVLARELTLREIAAASAVPGIETEVFVQGAMCFSVSGRCLLSSWVGGRSGNRGACTSPCRVPWSADEQPAGTPLSMRDLSLIHRLDDLKKAGVSALKIEGRLKNAAWVRQAVSLYRRAMEGEEPQGLVEEAGKLGAYTGRALTWGYLDGNRDELTGASGRASLPLPEGEGTLYSGPLAMGEGICGGPSEDVFSAEELAEEGEGPIYDFSMNVGPKGIDCRVDCGGQSTDWSIPKSVVRRKHKAAAIGQLLAWLETQTIQGCRAAHTSTNDPEFLLVPRAVNALVDRISAAIRLAQKAPQARVRIDLPEQVAGMLTKRSTAAANRLRLGDAPDRVRLEAGQVQEFLRQVRPGGLIVDCPTPQGLERTLAAAGDAEVVVALPQVFFEEEIPAIKDLIRLCARADVTVEVNSWGGWWLARRAGVRMESGPGLPVLNGLAARRLREAGIRCVTLSIEAQRKQLEELSAVCSVPCSLVVFGRPALLTTRAQLPRSRFLGKVLADRRGVRLVPRVERGLWVFRPVEPFDLRASGNERIRAQHLVVDLVGSDDPVGEWFEVPLDNKRTFRFNYDRSLACASG